MICVLMFSFYFYSAVCDKKKIKKRKNVLTSMDDRAAVEFSISSYQELFRSLTGLNLNGDDSDAEPLPTDMRETLDESSHII